MIRTFAFACALATLAASPVWAQNAPSQTAPGPNASPTAAQAGAPASADAFVKTQSIGEWRAAKLVGVTVIGADNKKLGQIKDVLIDHDGAAQTIVISAGGFLGVGGKMVAVPFKAMKWRTEGRTVEVAAPSSGGGGSTSAGGGSTSTEAMAVKTDPAATEANQGYPDVAELDLTEAQLKQAPDFNYAPEPTAPAGGGTRTP